MHVASKKTQNDNFCLRKLLINNCFCLEFEYQNYICYRTFKEFKTEKYWRKNAFYCTTHTKRPKRKSHFAEEKKINELLREDFFANSIQFLICRLQIEFDIPRKKRQFFHIFHEFVTFYSMILLN